MNKLTLTKLNPVEKRDGRPIRYCVEGTNDLPQKFSTLREARYYMLLRRTAVTQSDAIETFVATCLL
jgi:hypothetical protein